MKKINQLMTMRSSTVLLFLFLSLRLLATETTTELQNPVKGKVVTKKDGLGLPGATITVKGTKLSTISDMDGNFTIEVLDEKSVLVITYTGYKTQEIAINGRTSINVALDETSTVLDEVVVVGYGNQKKGDLTGAITKVKASDLNQGSANLNAAQMLEGRLAGVYINQNTADPGKDPVITIRGNGTLNVAKAGRPNGDNPNSLYNPLIGGSADPLVIVDGFQLSHLRDMNTISPNDIESYTVLKDASATAIYGSRGANGVIIITTKNGKRYNKIDVNYYTQFAVSSVVKKLDLLNASQYLNYYYDLSNATGLTLDASKFKNIFPNQSAIDAVLATGVNTNWQKQVLAKDRVNQSHYLTFSGGNEVLKYVVSGNYLTSYTAVAPGDYKRYNGKTKIGYEKGKFGLDVSMSYTNERNDNDRYLYNSFSDDENSQNKYNLWYAILSDPSQSVFKQDGSYSINRFETFRENPLFATSVTTSYWVQKTNYLNASAHYEILPGFKLTTNLGTSKVSYEAFQNVRAIWSGGTIDYKNNFASATYRTSGDSMAELFADYSKKFANKHNITALLGASEGSKNYHDLEAAGYDFKNSEIGFNGLQGSAVATQPRTSRYKSTSRSFFGRVNYNFDDTYLVSLNFRADGASQFGVNNKYGFYPSASVGWKINKEPFMKDFKSIWNLKLRLSYGTAGNDNIPNGLSNLRYQYVGYSNDTALKLVGDYVPNPNLKWESIATSNLGLDLGYKNLTATLDFYFKKSSDLLLTKDAPIESGYKYVIQNQGQVENKGFETTVGYTFYNLLGTKLNYVPQINFSYNYSIITDLGGDSVVPNESGVYVNRNPQGDTMLREAGHPFNSFYLYHFDGIWQTGEKDQADIYNAKPGDPKIRDVNEDGVLDKNDKYYAGTADPTINFGFANNFYYKNFEFRFFFQGVFGNKTYNQTRLVLENPSLGYLNNLSTEVLDRWTPTNPSNTNNSNLNPVSKSFIESDKYLENASFLRLKEVNVLYHLKMGEKVAVKELLFGLGVTNVFTITQYKGLNPEVWHFDNQWNLNPYLRTVTLSLNVNF